MVLVTDAEEAGLMGAAALVHDREVTDRLQAYLNVEASGSSGVPLLFETGPGNHWLVANGRRLPGILVAARSHGDLRAAAERYRLFNSSTPRNPRSQLRNRR